MSRESWEVSEESFDEMFMGKIQLGNPDIHGYPAWNGPEEDDEAGTQEDSGSEWNLTEPPF